MLLWSGRDLVGGHREQAALQRRIGIEQGPEPASVETAKPHSRERLRAGWRGIRPSKPDEIARREEPDDLPTTVGQELEDLHRAEGDVKRWLGGSPSC